MQGYPGLMDGIGSKQISSEFDRIRDAAHSLMQDLETRLQRDWPDSHDLLFPHRPIALAAHPTGTKAYGYGHLAPWLVSFLRNVSAHDHAAQTLARRVLMLDQLQAACDGPQHIQLPQSVLQLYPRECERILLALQAPDCTADLTEDRWKKNLAILNGRLVPVGAEFADIHAGIPRSIVVKGGLAQSLRVLHLIAFGTRGFGPMLELHAHPDSLTDFNADGWRASYHRLAEILLLNPTYRGVMASSWFRDPALATISPRLRYLRDYPQQYGAEMFAVGVDTQGNSGALVRSPTRQRLFHEGRYVPTIHLMLWPRATLLAWHHKTKV